MKKIICTVAAAAMLMSTTAVLAQAPVIDFNGERMSFDAEPYITDAGNTMVPFRAIFEKADAVVQWDEETKTVVAVKTDGDTATSVVLQIGSDKAFVNDQMLELESAPELTEDRTFVPLRFVMESLGAKVDWDGDTYTVSITTE